jgi:hypothetical protein
VSLGRRWGTALELAYLAMLVSILLFFAWLAVWWRPLHDAHLMLYEGLLMELYGQVPYRDFFEMNPPGTLLLHQWLVSAFGTSDLAFRAIDLSWLAATLLAVVCYMRRWGWSAAVCAACIFGISYLDLGAMHSFQREYLCVLPVTLGLLLAFRCPRWPAWVRAFLLGLLFGAVVTVKPLVGVALPVIFAGLVASGGDDDWSALLRPRLLLPLGLSCGVGLLILPLLCLAYLKAHGALGEFGELVSHYWPLYAQLRGDGSVSAGLFEWGKAASTLEVVFKYRHLALAAVGLFSGLPLLLSARRCDRNEMVVLILLALSLVAYVFLSGKAWTYHGIPLYFVLSLFAGLTMVSLGREAEPRAGRLFKVALLIVLTLLPLRLPKQTARLLAGGTFMVRPEVEAVADYLTEHLEPGDRVQPIDTTKGAVHAMLIAKARLATSFLYDFHFYHHPGQPYVQALRRRMVEELRSSRPRYIVRHTRPWRPHGPNTAARFEELERIIELQYQVVFPGSRLQILERRTPADAAG